MAISEYYNWLKRDWAKVGFILSIFLFVFLFVFLGIYGFAIFLILLQTPLYMLHETEEYVFPGGFARFFHRHIFKLDTDEGPLTENFIFYINVILVWILLPAFGLLSVLDYAYGLWILYFSLFAGVAHILMAIRARKLYNPGLAVSLLLNIPVSLWSIFYMVEVGVLDSLFLNYHTLIGLGLNALLPVMGIILYKKYQRRQ